jgi:hypothetical protein
MEPRRGGCGLIITIRMIADWILRIDHGMFCTIRFLFFPSGVSCVGGYR